MEESSALICGVKRRLTPTSSRVTVPVVVEVCVVVAELEVAALVTSLDRGGLVVLRQNSRPGQDLRVRQRRNEAKHRAEMLASRTPSVILRFDQVAGVVVSTAVKSAAEVDPGTKRRAL